MNWNNEQLIREVVAESKTYSETLRKLGLNPFGSNPKTLKKYINKYNIDISHFNAKEVMLPKPRVFASELFSRKTATASLRRCILRENLLEYKCAICGISHWQNQKLSLNLDHIDGDRSNNKLENLRWLCPNCDSLQKTYKGKNKRTVA